ncbi:MAG: YdcF family protein [Nocardiopsaceae bacterium]|nr:YdcF family protein [Nocardiopsaceae bacterium]
MSLAFFLLWDGVTMLRREGRRPANLLALFAGLGMFAYPGLYVLVAHAHVRWMEIVFLVVARPLAYVVFLFSCFLLYSLVYGRIPYRGVPDFVVVLGSGLIGGDRVPPLLASRLDRAYDVIAAAAAKGRYPMLITSGGQGPGETVPEGRAMAGYLLARGIPAERIAVEDESRTTWENLRFSARIMDELRPGSRCLVVTNNFHVMRTARLTRRLKLNASVIGSRTALYFWPSAIIREFVAVFLSYRITNIIICGLLFIPPLRGF